MLVGGGPDDLAERAAATRLMRERGGKQSSERVKLACAAEKELKRRGSSGDNRCIHFDLGALLSANFVG